MRPSRSRLRRLGLRMLCVSFYSRAVKDELQCKLDNPVAVHGSRYLTARPLIHGSAGRVEYGMIGDIEEFRAELQAGPLGNGNVLQHRKVYLLQIIRAQNIAPTRAER